MDEGMHVSHDDMIAAIGRGDATPLAATVTWLARYKDAWWIVYESGWLKVTDQLAVTDIEHSAAHITTTEQVRRT